MEFPLADIWALLNKPMKVPSPHAMLHSSEHYCHMAYSGLVAIEAHGFYAYAAGGLFVIALLAMFLREEV